MGQLREFLSRPLEITIRLGSCPDVQYRVCYCESVIYRRLDGGEQQSGVEVEGSLGIGSPEPRSRRGFGLHRLLTSAAGPAVLQPNRSVPIYK